MIDYSKGTSEEYLRNFLLLQLCIHGHSLIKHVVVNLYEAKYYEFLLHHGMAFLLVIFGYVTNLWIIASCTLMLHDISDVFLLMVRIMADYKHRNKATTIKLFVLNTLVWFYSRSIYFPSCIIAPLYRQTIKIHLAEKEEHRLQQPLLYFYCFMLFILAVMHVYWLLFMIKGCFYYN